MENEPVNDNTQNVETDDQPVETTTVDETDVTALKKKLDETTQANRQLFERAKKAEGFVKLDGKWVKASKPEPKPEAKVEPKAKTGELDETTLDYLDLKGINEQEDIKIIEDIVKKTGQTVRQVLKDEYVQAKLNANKLKREVKVATPNRTNRGGNQEADIAASIAKFEQTGALPDDFALKSAVINAVVDKSSTNKPAWH